MCVANKGEGLGSIQLEFLHSSYKGGGPPISGYYSPAGYCTLPEKRLEVAPKDVLEKFQVL